MRYIVEAENRGATLGVPFPSLPACLLGPSKLASKRNRAGSQGAEMKEESWSGRRDWKPAITNRRSNTRDQGNFASFDPAPPDGMRHAETKSNVATGHWWETGKRGVVETGRPPPTCGSVRGRARASEGRHSSGSTEQSRRHALLDLQLRLTVQVRSEIRFCRDSTRTGQNVGGTTDTVQKEIRTLLGVRRSRDRAALPCGSPRSVPARDAAPLRASHEAQS